MNFEDPCQPKLLYDSKLGSISSATSGRIEKKMGSEGYRQDTRERQGKIIVFCFSHLSYPHVHAHTQTTKERLSIVNFPLKLLPSALIWS